MDAILVRPYEQRDWPRLMRIHDAARIIELTAAGLQNAFIPLETAAKSEGLFDYTVLVAEESGLVLGFVAFSADELAWLYVDPAHMRRGVGRRLAEQAIQETRARPFCLEVLKGNEAAIAFYKRMGFETVELCQGDMPGNESFRVTVHRMERN